MRNFLAKDHPNELTSYDLLKALAIILMILDHIGHHFFPDDMWFRVFGRLCVPIWFYLIGYAHSREVPATWFIGGGLLVLSSIVAGQYVFPVTILFSLAFARIWLDRIMVRALRNYEAFAGMFFLLFFLGFPTAVLFEYGTLGFLFTMLGCLRRNKADLNIKFRALLGFAAAASLAYILMQILLMPNVTWSQAGVFALGMVFVNLILFGFSSRSWPGFKKHAGFLLPPMHLLGRWTLEIYVLHLLAFRGLAMWLYPERFGFFDFQVVPPALISFFTP